MVNGISERFDDASFNPALLYDEAGNQHER